MRFEFEVPFARILQASNSVSKILSGFLDLRPGVNFLMTANAQRNEIGFGIVSELAAWVDMVNLKVSKTSTIPAPPSIPLEHLAPQFSIGA